MHKLLSTCPNCGGELAVTRLACTRCETVILAQYEPCAFCKLSRESLDFVLAFVRNRGNLKELERELGESYWALRTRLNGVIGELGFEVQPTSSDDDLTMRREEILARLERGEIGPQEATSALAALRDA